LVLVATACWFSLFNRLEAQPMQVYDEIRLADNAIEMAQTGGLLVTRFDGRPETWNTKPPLQIWLEALSVKALGIRSLAFRLPSALAALLTVFLLFMFARRELDDIWGAALAATLLLSSSGFVLIHSARNGEYDALLVLWMLAASLAFFRFVWRLDEKWLWLTALFMVLAVYTKGVQGLILLPGFLVYAAVAGRFRAVFARKNVYAAMCVALLIVGLYYGVREQLQPGYLHEVWQNELFGRYAVVNEGHNATFFAYFVAMKWWTLVLLFGALALPLMKGEDRRVGVFTIVVAFSYLLLISVSKTKLEWYAAPVYPFLSLLAVVTLRSFLHALRPNAAWIRPAVFLLTCATAVFAISAITKGIDWRDHPMRVEEKYPAQLAAFQAAFPARNHIVLGTPKDKGPGVYYREYFARRGMTIQLQRLGDLRLRRGETILTSTPQVKRRLRDDYDTKKIFSYEGMDGVVVERVLRESRADTSSPRARP
jgi:4-amino-4-deoxy-L-arabinose transferase-like glycosyltransferase